MEDLIRVSEAILEAYALFMLSPAFGKACKTVHR
jgi:hypothetical protein